MVDDFYAEIAKAAASGGGTYVNDGIYKFMIEKMFRKDSATPGGGGTSFITEFRVIESSVHPNHPEVKPNPVGSTCSVVANVTKHASAFGNIKALLLGALGAFGYAEEDITPEVIANAFTSDDLRGLMVEDTTYRKNIKSGANMGKPITLHKWTPIEQDEATVAKQRADLDAGKYSVKTKQVAAAVEEATAQPETKRTSLLSRPKS